MIMNDEVYLAFMLALSDQLTDLQKNGMTYPDGKAMLKAYHQVMSLISTKIGFDMLTERS